MKYIFHLELRIYIYIYFSKIRMYNASYDLYGIVRQIERNHVGLFL